MDKMREAFEKWAESTIHTLGKRLAELLDEDQFAECETLLLKIVAQTAAVPVVGDVEALICDDCGAETNDPWHDSKGTNRHYHRCDPCNSITAAELDALRKDAERYRWMRDKSHSLETRQYDKGIRNGPSCYHKVEGIRELKYEDALDAAIDAAIAGEKQ